MSEMQKVYNMIGLCNKASRLITGQELCEKQIRRNNVFLVIIATDTGQNTKKEMTNICHHYGVDLVEFGTGDMLGKMTGKETRKVIGIKDLGFKKEILKRMQAIGEMNE